MYIFAITYKHINLALWKNNFDTFRSRDNDDVELHDNRSRNHVNRQFCKLAKSADGARVGFELTK